ncbi:protein translocase subunit SecD [Candidatus Dependentiae bacterium]|nr:protein translocase subunit SecD [Candidatus Dependentiae bacterium]
MNIRALLFSWLSFWVVVGAIGLYFLYPLRNTLRFGIDLVGGTYITLEVQTDKAVESVLLEKLQAISNKLESADKMPVDKKVVVESHSQTKKINKHEIVLIFASIADAQAAALLLREEKNALEQKIDGTILKIILPDREVQKISEDAVGRNIEVLRTRLDKMSVAEITIARQGDRQIVVELPDVSDPQQAKAMIGKAAMLEFKPVEKIGASPDDIRFEFDGEIPGDMQILPFREEDGKVKEYYLVPKYADVTGKYLTDARPRFDEQTAQLVVDFLLTPEGGNKFYDLTSKYYQRRIAIVLDDVVISAPSVSARIRNNGYITGGFSSAQAKELALLLKSGAFVAPVTLEEERQIGPVLGEESIKQGFLSCLVGLVLLFIFSLIYYKLSGIFAFIALVFNLLLVLLGLAWLRATLTLPGIAGMILTIGMAVDASILIFERIKEELQEGTTIKKAVTTGFANVMSVIIDANITTFIVGIVLYKFGTGPIQGFAVTMMLGIIATLITGLFFLRSLFNAFLNGFKIEKLSI